MFLGALAQLADCVDRESVEEAIRQYMPAKLHEGNIKVVERAIALVQQAEVAGHEESADDESAGQPRAAAESVTALHRSAHSSAVHMPQLFATVPEPSAYADTTCYAAGYLTQVNAGWRNVRPVLNASACTGCLQCYLYCRTAPSSRLPARTRRAFRWISTLISAKAAGFAPPPASSTRFPWRPKRTRRRHDAHEAFSIR